jgi:hypothetical protein
MIRRRAFSPVVWEALAVLALYTGVAVFATWPLARHPLGGFYGFGNDNWGGIWVFGWIHDAYLGPERASVSPDLETPFGYQIAEHALQPLDRLLSLLLGGFDQGLGTYNAQVFLSFVLAGCTMYLLARYLTGSPLAAAVAGFAFTFSPFHLAMAMQYNALASIQWLPLYLLALLVTLRHGRLRDAALTGAAFALVAFTSYYYAWFTIWFTLIVGVVFVARLAWARHRASALTWSAVNRFLRLGVTRVALGAAVALVLAGPFLVPSLRASSSETALEARHPLTEAVRYSARPWMFFIPPHDNPIAGDRVEPWVMSHLYDSPVHEQSVYLGYMLLALAAIGLWRMRREPGEVAERARFARPLLVAGAIAAFVITLGPYIPLDGDYWRLWAQPNATRHLPSIGLPMFTLAPIFRFFSRADVLLSMCLAALAAIGFARLERRFDARGARLALAGAVLTLMGLEYTNAPPHIWFDATAPPWVTAVRALPKNAKVVDYPVSSLSSPRSLYYMFWQREHGRPTVNPPGTTRSQAFAASIQSPDEAATGRALHEAGIDYAIIHTALPPQTTVPYQPGLPDDSMPANSGALNPWFQRVARTPDAVIYRVLGSPRQTAGAVVRPGEGFGPPEPEAGTTARWLQEPSGTLDLFVTGRPRHLTALFSLASFARPRLVSISLGRRRLATFEVPAGSYPVRPVPLGRLAAGRYVLRLEAKPGPQSIQATTGAPDPRSVSVRLREPVSITASTR